MLKTLVLPALLSLLLGPVTHAGCEIRTSDGSPARRQNDVLFIALAQATPCPHSVQELKSLLKDNAFQIKPTMVGNRGRNNPQLGSFSFFEIVAKHPIVPLKDKAQADLFFGHFTQAHNGEVELDQAPERGKLMIELIAWDPKKRLYNFYELIGAGRANPIWFFRGDSADILADNAKLYLSAPGEPPQFGQRLRCSGCHSSGGPIMKELSVPHNDWWLSERTLPFGPNRPSSEVKNQIADIAGASVIAQYVHNGMMRLEASPTYKELKNSMSLRAKLRPLFCEVEINIESAPAPNEAAKSSVQIPSAFLVSPILGDAKIQLSSEAYFSMLNEAKMKFPETDLPDADHPWLTPVKGESDLLAIKALLKSGIVDLEFVTDVTAIDMEHPNFSKKRCGLLQLVPQDGGLGSFKAALARSELPGAQDLLQNLEDPSRNRKTHVLQAQKLVEATQTKLKSKDGAREVFKNLIELRAKVFKSEISQNPRGQILEPGFRVIFPEPNTSARAFRK